MVKQAKLVNLVSTVGETQKGILEMHFLPTPFFKTHFPKSPFTWVATFRNATFGAREIIYIILLSDLENLSLIWENVLSIANVT